MSHPTLTRTRSLLVQLAELQEKRAVRAKNLGIDLQELRLRAGAARKAYREARAEVDAACADIDQEIEAVREDLKKAHADRKTYLAANRSE